ncbi:MAG: hypothetical protein KBA51_06905 [Kiritimatiellae bacterium]|nr:hypothetical protein [Kiritimatiellia bacterium]
MMRFAESSQSAPTNESPWPADAARTVRALMEQGSPVTFQAGGRSMHPVIRDGDTVRVRPAGPDDFRRGAVMLFAVRERLILHRLLRQESRSGMCVMAGDARLGSEEILPASDIHGVAEWVRRGERLIRLDTFRARQWGLMRRRIRTLRAYAGSVLRRRGRPPSEDNA